MIQELIINNDRDIHKLMKNGFRSYENPDGKIEQLGGITDRESAKDVARRLSVAEPNKKFYILKTKDRDCPYDVVYKEKSQLLKEEKEELEENDKLRRRLLRL